MEILGVNEGEGEGGGRGRGREGERERERDFRSMGSYRIHKKE